MRSPLKQIKTDKSRRLKALNSDPVMQCAKISQEKARQQKTKHHSRAKNLAKRLRDKQARKEEPIMFPTKSSSHFRLFPKPTIIAENRTPASPTRISAWDAFFTKPTALPLHLTNPNHKHKRTFAPILNCVVYPFDPIWLYDEVVLTITEGVRVTRAGFSAGDSWKINDKKLGKYCCKPS